MATTYSPEVKTVGTPGVDKHPRGLYVLFATEMWERFSFYSMLALFTLYMQDGRDGFSWTPAQATALYANYLAFVYASPLIGGILADWKLGYRRAVMIGGLFFMAGHLLLSFRSLTAVYAALTCLVVGNGFFKPNVSTMVGNLYPEGSHLKDRAYNIFYMGINIGAFIAPIVMEIVREAVGFHPAFAVAAFGMLISVGILWKFKKDVEDPGLLARKKSAKQMTDAAAVAVDAPPTGISHQRAIDAVPDYMRIGALVVIYVIVIVFWMAFHQNGSTLTYWADDNTDWNVTGTISNAINPGWIIGLSFPLVWFWKWLDKRGKEPGTPVKIAMGMFLTALSFTVLFLAAKTGEGKEVRPDMIATGSFRVNERVMNYLRDDGIPDALLTRLATSKNAAGKFIVNDKKFTSDGTLAGAFDTIKEDLEGDKTPDDVLKKFDGAKAALKQYGDVKVGDPQFATGFDAVTQSLKDAGLPDDVLGRISGYKNKTFTAQEKLGDAVKKATGTEPTPTQTQAILTRAFLFKVSPFWLILSYAIISLGELMLSPMGLSLVSKVAPIRMRGMMMGGWFVATAIGNKLTMIGVYWSVWKQSSFFIILGGMAFIMGCVLLLLLKPLKKAMPGV